MKIHTFSFLFSTCIVLCTVCYAGQGDETLNKLHSQFQEQGLMLMRLISQN